MTHDSPLDQGALFILASGSPRRRELIDLLGLPVRVETAQVVEAACNEESPPETAARLALAKARAVAVRHPSAFVLGCDTVVALDGALLGKPAHAAQATAMLTALRGRTHAVYTGIALVEGAREATDLAETTVRMRAYTDAELTAYVATGDPLDKAGAYAIQHATFRPVAGWDGCYANVMGLPLCHVARLLAAWRVFPTPDVPAACQAYTGHACHYRL
ncbi:MAG: septum formation protein Maf [Anaerolineae bacterium]|nr:septum formation protein Maf [Anaerolineae bacterium]